MSKKKRLELWPGQCASDIHTPFDVIKSWLVIKRAWYTRTTPRIYSFWQSGKDNKKRPLFSNYWFATVHKNNKRRTRKNFLLFAKIGLLLLGFCWPPKNSADRSDRLWHTRVTLASKTDNDQSSDSWKNLLLHTINLQDFLHWKIPGFSYSKLKLGRDEQT